MESETREEREWIRAVVIRRVKELRDKAFSTVEIAKKLGLSESSVRSLLNTIEQAEFDGTL